MLLPSTPMSLPLSSTQSQAPTARAKSQHQPYLDGLRGVAILGVLADHFHVPLPPLFHVGPVGVRFFFILTGYFITLSLWKVRDAVTESPRDRNFHIGRYWSELCWEFGKSTITFSGWPRFRRIPTSSILVTGRRQFPISGRWPCRNSFISSGRSSS
jgi:hypothetical protein